MQTILKKPLLFNLLLWATLFVLWVLIFQNNTLTFSRTAGIQFCYLVFIASNYYFNTAITIPSFMDRRKYFLFVFTGLLCVIVTSWMRAEVAYYINTRFYHTPNLDFSVIFANSLVNIFVWTVIIVAGKIVADKIKHERNIEAIEKEKTVNELNFLRAQHNPHFLFNSLNAIYFQIDKTNQKARDMLMLLSEMLRYQLYECTTEKIPIDKEIAYLKNYIELQKFRLNENYTIDFHVDSSVKSFEISPLLIIPLIENAFKYISHHTDRDNELKVDLSLQDGLVTCSIKNTVEATSRVPQPLEGGIGLKNLQRRLELLYPATHEMVIDNDDNYYSVKLALKVHEN